jgi:hypothetical protein
VTQARRRSSAIFWGVAAAVVAVCAAVMVEGAPLADDLNNCLAPREQGLDGFFAESWDRLGLVRAARFVEILLTTGVCRSIPFGAAIAAGLALFLGAGLALRRLLRDLEVADPWPDIGGALWLLQPLGTEISLWPAALHVPLGLLSALLALLAWRRRRWLLGALAAAVAFLSVEQLVLALPLAAWLVAVPRDRRKVAFIAGALVAGAAAAFLSFPGNDPRLEVGLGERLRTVVSDVGFYVGYPAVGLGLHSIPLAVAWAFPWSLAVLAAGAAAGRGILGPLLGNRASGRVRWGRGLAKFASLILLLNVPVVLNVPHQGSPRVFAPTWMALAAGAAFAGARARLTPALLGTAIGTLSAAMLLSIAFSVSVRLDSARFVRWASERIAASSDDGDVVAVCDVRRTVVTPAPRGAFAVHDFLYDWAAQDAVSYYAGRNVTIELGGEILGSACPPPGTVDVRFGFDRLVSEWVAQ